jgi:hypothetical protein
MEGSGERLFLIVLERMTGDLMLELTGGWTGVTKEDERVERDGCSWLR